MADRKVYGALTSPATLRALASLYEHDLDFEFISVDMDKGDHKKDSFLALNPFGEIPALQDGDLTLFESRAIMRYIAFAYPIPAKEHIFKNPRIQGIVAGWIDIEDHEFTPPVSTLIDEFLIKPKSGLSPNATIVSKEEEKLAKVLDVYEEWLQKVDYLVGNKFTSADLTHLPGLYYLMATPSKHLIESRPNVCSWRDRIMARSAWTQVLEMIEESAA